MSWRKYLGVNSLWATLPLQLLIFVFSSQALTSSEFLSARQIFLLKSAWMNSKVFPLALKRMSLNSATAMCVHILLESIYGVIGPTSIIKGSTYQYIVGRVTIAARGVFLIHSSFCTSSYPRTPPIVLDSLEFQSVLFELEGSPNFPCDSGQTCCASINQMNSSARWGPFTGNTCCPCATKFMES